MIPTFIKETVATEIILKIAEFPAHEFGRFSTESDTDKFIAFLNSLVVKIWYGDMYTTGSTNTSYKFFDLIDDTNVAFFASAENIMTWMMTCSDLDNISEKGVVVELVSKYILLSGLIEATATGMHEMVVADILASGDATATGMTIPQE